MRITTRMLESRLIKINNLSNKEKDFDLNHNSIYGGWQMTSNEGSHIIQHRITAKQMLLFLDGMIAGIFLN